MRRLIYRCILALLLLATSNAFAEAKSIGYGTELEGFSYPYTVEHFQFSSQGQDLQMGYMDVAPVPPQLEMDIPAVCIKGLQGALLSTLWLIGT